MRRIFPGPTRGHRAFIVVCAILFLVAPIGAGPVKKRKEPPPPKAQETVGDLAFVVSRGEMKVEGVGLVMGLDNTGADPPPSWWRKQLVDEMSKASVPHPDRLLADPRVSMVLVTLTIPIGVNPTDRLDVQVEVPPACGTKSLAGGYLLMTRLREVLLAGNTPKGGQDLALAQGPIMIGTPTRPNDPKVGRVLGGGRVKKDNPFTLAIKNNRKSFRTSKLLEDVVNQRFHQTENGHQKGAVNAKTDSYLELKVPNIYHQNQDHFFRVVQYLPVLESPELQARRLGDWSKELLEPKTAGVAAMKLEGMGTTAIEALTAGLKSNHPQVRFFSAESLAYLGETTGVEILGEAVVSNPDFRVYALAALSSMDQPASHLKLRKLMDNADVGVRYGAFNALRTLDPSDPFLGRVRVLDQPKTEENEETPDRLALAIIAANNHQRQAIDDPFWLYVVDSEGPPLVHVSRSRRSEIVIFGRQQKLLPPIVLGTGPYLLNAADHDDAIEISKIVPSRSEDGDSKVSTTLDLADILRRTANLGASYPELVTILEAAYQQKNLSGALIIDAVPASSRLYLEAVLGKDITAKRDDSLSRASHDSKHTRRRGLFGFFSRDEEPASTRSTEPPTKPPTPKTNTSNTPDNAAQGDSLPALPPAKADEDLQKAALEPPTLRDRFLDLFRRDDNP